MPITMDAAATIKNVPNHFGRPRLTSLFPLTVICCCAISASVVKHYCHSGMGILATWIPNMLHTLRYLPHMSMNSSITLTGELKTYMPRRKFHDRQKEGLPQSLVAGGILSQI